METKNLTRKDFKELCNRISEVVADYVNGEGISSADTFYEGEVVVEGITYEVECDLDIMTTQPVKDFTNPHWMEEEEIYKEEITEDDVIVTSIYEIIADFDQIRIITCK